MKRISFMIAGVLGFLSIPGTAQALPQSVHRIPHGTVFGCATCHPGGAEDQLNPFGALLQGIRHAHVGPEDWWTIMYNVDSDGDGLTNGEELGDPCGDWVLGAEMPRVAEVSNPGDPDNWVDLAEEPSCPPLPVADDPPGGSEAVFAAQDLSEGACSFQPAGAGGSSGAALAGAALALTGLGALFRRDRAKRARR